MNTTKAIATLCAGIAAGALLYHILASKYLIVTNGDRTVRIQTRSGQAWFMRTGGEWVPIKEPNQ